MSNKTNASLMKRREAAVPRGVGQIHPIFAESAKNATVTDVEGREFIDFAGGIAVLNTGHLHPKIIAAVQEQLAKLLDGYRSAVHWESLPAAKEAFLQVKFGEQLYALDRNRYTCSGGTASMDMMLHIIRLQHGKALATAVSQQFVMERIRDDSTTQYKPHTEHIGPGYDYVHTAIELMQANLDEVLAMQEIADLIPLSLRQMERLFKRYCNMSPAQYYLRLRLQRAKELLAQTSMSVMQVTVACGFSTSSHFSKAYRSYYGYSPREQRKPSDPAFQFKIAGSGGVFNAFGR